MAHVRKYVAKLTVRSTCTAEPCFSRPEGWAVGAGTAAVDLASATAMLNRRGWDEAAQHRTVPR